MGDVFVTGSQKGAVGRLLSAMGTNADGTSAAARLDRYGDQFVKPLGLKEYAEEGSMFVVTNPTISTGVKLQGDTTTAWVATTPSLLIENNAAVGGKNLIMDHVKLLVTAAGAGLATLHVAVLIDNTLRYASGGTALTPVNPNMGVASSGTGALVYYGATAAAASANVRIVGRDVVRGAIPVVNDVYVLNFGKESAGSGVTDGTTTIMRKVVAFPPVVIAPQGSLLIYLWAASMSTSPSCELEAAWTER